jgi:hypothetical protein
MSEHRHIPEPGELIHQPSSSWAPPVFAFALTLALCSIFISFMLPSWAYALIGIVVALFAFRGMVRGGIRDYYSLPRKQHVRGAVLPVETISPPKG